LKEGSTPEGGSGRSFSLSGLTTSLLISFSSVDKVRETNASIYSYFIFFRKKQKRPKRSAMNAAISDAR
jgi:hypothetical protein